MNREILFRGKRIDNGKWVEGYLLRYSPIFEELTYILPIPAVAVNEVEVDPSTACQYISYTDLRKKKVFEHDIVYCEDNDHFGEIVYKEGRYLVDWGESYEMETDDVEFWFKQRRMYVVGNIFDNPELLED